MAFFVRKISRNKWPSNMCDINDLSADAISDLRTTNNTLSIWRVDSEDELEHAILALAASSKVSRIENMSIVWIDEKELEKYGIKISDKEPGDTVVDDLKRTHRDICDVTYKSLGDIARIILSEINEKEHVKRITKTEVRNLLVSAYNDKRLLEEKCMPELIDEIKKYI